MTSGVVRLTYDPDGDADRPWVVEAKMPDGGWDVVDSFPDLQDGISMMLGYVGD